jgi:hypothetical protein
MAKILLTILLLLHVSDSDVHPQGVFLKPPIDQHNTHNQTPTDTHSGNTHTLMGKAAKH